MINIDTVYQTVQALANKEQRGYITPQEFNLFCNQAQSDIFEQYFYDLNALRAQRPEQYAIGDSVTHIMQKLQNWFNVNVVPQGEILPQGDGLVTGKLFYRHGTPNSVEMRLTTKDEIDNIINNKFFTKHTDEVLYFRESHNRIQVYARIDIGNGMEFQKLPLTTTDVSCEVISGKPRLVFWGYMVINESPVYNAMTSQHFQLDASEQADIVIKVLALAGISLEDPQLYQAAASINSQNQQQENK